MCDLMPSSLTTAMATASVDLYNCGSGSGGGGGGDGSGNAVAGQNATITTNAQSGASASGKSAPSQNFSSALSSGLNLAFTNPKGAKLLADFKQIILELSMTIVSFPQ